jgi:hypothetical protein
MFPTENDINGNVNANGRKKGYKYSIASNRGFATDDDSKYSESLFPGTIANDPRVATLTFHARPERKYDIPGAVYGHFSAHVDIILQPMRSTDVYITSAEGGDGGAGTALDVATAAAGVATATDIAGLWVDSASGGYVHIQTQGDTFVAVEYPHARYRTMLKLS